MRYLLPLDKLEDYIFDNPLEVQESYIKIVESDDSEVCICMTLEGVYYTLITFDENDEVLEETYDVPFKDLVEEIKLATKYIKDYEESVEIETGITEEHEDIIVDYAQAFGGLSSLLIDLGVYDEEIADNVFNDFCESLESYRIMIT